MVCLIVCACVCVCVCVCVLARVCFDCVLALCFEEIAHKRVHYHCYQNQQLGKKKEKKKYVI